MRLELLVAIFLLMLHVALAGIIGHSGVILHIDKYGHLSGHSSRYDYRVYPQKHYPIAIPEPHIAHIAEPHVVKDHDSYEVLNDVHHEGEEQPVYYLIEDNGEGDHHHYYPHRR